MNATKVKEKLDKVKQILANFDEQANKDSYATAEIEELKYALQDTMFFIDWIRDDIDRLFALYREHKEGHLPPLKSKEQMQRAIDVLGLSDEYTVEPKVISASQFGNRKNKAKITLVK